MGFNVLFLPEDLLETDDRRLVRNHSFPQLFDFNGLLVYRARLALSELLELVLEFGNSCVFFLALLLKKEDFSIYEEDNFGKVRAGRRERVKKISMTSEGMVSMLDEVEIKLKGNIK